MSENDIDASANTAVTVHKNQPYDTDGNILKHDDIDAHIEGTMYELGKHLERTGAHKLLLSDDAVALSNGKIAVSSANALHFLVHGVDDPHDFAKPCPATNTRRTDVNTARSGGSLAALAPLATVPKEHAGIYVVSKPHVDKDDSEFLQILFLVFGHCDSCKDAFGDAKGSGRAAKIAIDAIGAAADQTDKALATAELTECVRNGVSGELTSVEPLTSFVADYKRKLRNVTKLQRPSDEAAAEMISLIALSDPSVSASYRLASRLNPPTNLESAVKLLKAEIKSNQG